MRRHENRTELRFAFTTDALQLLDSLTEQTGLDSRADVIKNALRVYEWFVTKVDEEDIIEIKDRDSQVKHSIPGYRLYYRR